MLRLWPVVGALARLCGGVDSPGRRGTSSASRWTVTALLLSSVLAPSSALATAVSSPADGAHVLGGSPIDFSLDAPPDPQGCYHIDLKVSPSPTVDSLGKLSGDLVQFQFTTAPCLLLGETGPLLTGFRWNTTPHTKPGTYYWQMTWFSGVNGDNISSVRRLTIDRNPAGVIQPELLSPANGSVFAPGDSVPLEVLTPPFVDQVFVSVGTVGSKETNVPAPILYTVARTDPTRAGAKVFTGNWKTLIQSGDPRSRFPAGNYFWQASYVDCTPNPLGVYCSWVSDQRTIELREPAASSVSPPPSSVVPPPSSVVSAACVSARRNVARWRAIRTATKRALARARTARQRATLSRRVVVLNRRLVRLSNARTRLCP
jgi:hypothetical protein